MTKDMIKATWASVEKDPSFWYDLLPLVTEDEAWRISELVECHDTADVYFVTNRYGLGVKHQTEQWVKRKLGILNPTVILTKRKGEVAKALGATHCIDDKASNASTVAWLTDDKTQSYLLDRPYNRVDKDFMASSVVRVVSVTEYLNIIEGVHDYATAGF